MLETSPRRRAPSPPRCPTTANRFWCVLDVARHLLRTRIRATHQSTAEVVSLSNKLGDCWIQLDHIMRRQRGQGGLLLMLDSRL